MSDHAPTVHIVDDDDGVRLSIYMLMKSAGLPASTFASAQDFLADQTARAGCVILDIRMPVMSGLELQQELNSRGAVIPVIFITGHGDVPMAVDAMRHGAFDFLQKPFRDQDLIDRVQEALHWDQEARKSLLEHSRIRTRLASLTPRERQVLDLLSAGKANKTMAHDLNLSQRTVEIHRARVMEKMAARSIAQLVRMVLDIQ
jgi:two-component system response regulator FixJ